MLYVLLAASALAALICCIVLLKSGRDEPVRHRPQWQDEITDEEYEADNPTPWRRDPPAWKKRRTRLLLRILEFISCMEFLLAVALLVLEIIK